MLNKVILHGRLVADPELKHTQGGVAVASSTVAVQRNYANKNGERETDFFNISAFKNTADFLAKYFKKGNDIIIEGSLRTSTYEKDGQKRTTFSIFAEQVYFAGGKASDTSNNQNKKTVVQPKTKVESVTPEEDLPF